MTVGAKPWDQERRDDREYELWLTRQGYGVRVPDEDYTDRYSLQADKKARYNKRAKERNQ